MEESKLKISAHPPMGGNWKEAWEGEASMHLLETLKANFEKLGFDIHVQLIIIEDKPESKVQRIFLYKLFLKKEKEDSTLI